MTIDGPNERSELRYFSTFTDDRVGHGGVQLLLNNKVGVNYGAGGSIGDAVARAFADEGALVCLAGRTEAKLATVAHHVNAKDGKSPIAVVDAFVAEGVAGTGHVR